MSVLGQDPLISEPSSELLNEQLFDADPETLIEFQASIDYLRRRSEITKYDVLESERFQHGVIHPYGFYTEAGYTYAAKVTIPDNQITDIPVLYTGAWGTSTDGHNEDMGKFLAQFGIPSIQVGNEGSYHPSLIPSVPHEPLTFAGSAAAALEFSRFISQKNFKYLLHPELRTSIGESKGGMEGMGLVALAEFFDQQMLMADFTAAGVPKRPSPAELLRFAEQFVRGEPKGVARLVGRIAIEVLTELPSTIDLHPYAAAHQLAKTPAIFSGEPGETAEFVDKYFKLHMTKFIKDGWSMPEEWKRIFASHSNTRITELDGWHLSLADPETRSFIVARQLAFHELFEAHGRRTHDENGKELFNGDDVWNAAHRYFKDCQRELPSGRIHEFIRTVLGTNKRLFGIPCPEPVSDAA